MEEYIRKAFKALEEFVETIEPKERPIKEFIEPEKSDEGKSVRDLFVDASSYIVTHSFEDGGLEYNLFLEGLNGGDSCDIMFEEFDVNNIESALVEVLDSEHEFIGSLTGEDITLDTPISEVISKASGVINGSEEVEVKDKEEVKVSAEGEEEEESNERVYVNGNPDAEIEVSTEVKEESLHEEAECSFEIRFKEAGASEEGVHTFSGEEEEKAKHEYDEFVASEDKTYDYVVLKKICGDSEEILASIGEVKESLTESQTFNITDKEDMLKAEETIEKSEDETIEQIVDASAESKEDLKKSYVGSIILQCPTCKSMMYKDPDQLVKVEGEEELYNNEEECPHCGAKDGFEIVGQVASLEVDPTAEPVPPMEEEPKEEVKKEEETVEVEEEKPEAEPMPALPKDEMVTLEPKEESLEEGINDVLAPSYKALEEAGIHFHVEGGKFEFDDEEDANKGLEILTGIHGEDKVNKEGFNVIVTVEEPIEESHEEEHKEEEEVCPKCHKHPCECEKEHCNECEIKLESLDEGKFDKLVTRYLKETYSNVQSYKTTKAGIDNDVNKIALEGMITFKSGKERPTKFIFEAKELNHKKQLKFVGINEMFAKSRAFTLVGTLDESKLLSESLSYHYSAGDKKVKGKVESLRKI